MTHLVSPLVNMRGQKLINEIAMGGVKLQYG
jgi:hypothetical protein